MKKIDQAGLSAPAHLYCKGQDVRNHLTGALATMKSGLFLPQHLPKDLLRLS